MKRKLPRLEKWIMVDLNLPTFVGNSYNHTNFNDGTTLHLQFVDLNPVTRELSCKYRCYSEEKREYFYKFDTFSLGEPDKVWVNTKIF